MVFIIQIQPTVIYDLLNYMVRNVIIYIMTIYMILYVMYANKFDNQL